MTNDTTSNAMPSATAYSKCPMFVSSMMAVVMTRVLYCTLPPTSMTAPTSPMERPKATNKMENNCERHSNNRHSSSRLRDSPMPCAVSCTRGATPAIAVADRPQTMGVMSTTCAHTMAGRV